VIDEDEMINRMQEQHIRNPFDHEFYVMQLTNDLYVDGKFQGNFSRFINHSCDPNCELQRWNVRGRIRIAIVAIKDIAPGFPLSYDYQFETQQEETFKCFCKTDKCRGTMAPNTDKRLLKMAKNGRNEELRTKLITAGKNKEKLSSSIKMLKEEELDRSLTNSNLPGDASHFLKNGPLKNTFHIASNNGIFLIRNVQKCSSLLRRSRRYITAASLENSSSSSSSSSSSLSSPVKKKRGPGRQNKSTSDADTPTTTTQEEEEADKSSSMKIQDEDDDNSPFRSGRKRKSNSRYDGERYF
jgi:hypothetical protein